jgi:hypothetical protein
VKLEIDTDKALQAVWNYKPKASSSTPESSSPAPD